MSALRSDVHASPSTGVGLLADSPRLLRVTLRADAVITGVNGLAYLALAGPLENLLGLDAGPGRALGTVLLVYAAVVGAVSMPTRIRRGAAMTIVGVNLAWTALSIAAVATGRPELNLTGSVWAVLQALVVAGFAALQYTALRRIR